MTKPYGLKEQIAHAQTEQEVIKLLQSGNSFADASPRTKLSWKHTAQRRLKQLVQQPAANSEPSTTTDTKKSVVKKAKKTVKKK